MFVMVEKLQTVRLCLKTKNVKNFCALKLANRKIFFILKLKVESCSEVNSPFVHSCYPFHRHVAVFYLNIIEICKYFKTAFIILYI